MAKIDDCIKSVGLDKQDAADLRRAVRDAEGNAVRGVEVYIASLERDLAELRGKLEAATVKVPVAFLTETPADYGSKNKLVSKSRADELRAKLRDKFKNQLSGGVDPETLAIGIELAAYHIEAGTRKFIDLSRLLAREMGESIDKLLPYLRSWYNGARDMMEDAGEDVADMDSAEAVKTGLAKLRSEVLGVPSPSERVEPDSGDGTAANGVGEEAVSPERDGAGQRAGTGKRAAEGGPGSDASVPDDGAAAVGEGGNRPVQAQQSEPERRPAERGGRGRGGNGGLAGLPVERTPTEAVDRVATGRIDLEASRRAQAAASKTRVVPASKQNIADTLPFLREPQQEDVLKAEERFEKPNAHGYLFTNGTGTGKTYVGGGLVARHYRQGKKNILIVAPSNGVLRAWLAALKNLDVPAALLESTEDAGKDIVLTTYANLGANRHLADRQWDLVVSDESHKLMSAKEGQETSALAHLRAITNYPDRLQLKARMQLRDLDDKVEAVNDKIRRNRFYQRTTTEREEAMQLDEQVRARVAKMRAEPRAKVLFLSATPFAYVEAIDYGNGYLFDYGPEPQARGYNTPDAKGAFFIQHFGYRMRTGRLTKPDAAVNSAVMERQFHEWMKREGAISGRVLDVDADYDRRFVLVDDAIGNKIDDIMKFLWETDDHRFQPIADLVREQFDYLARMRLLEAIKAHHAVDIIKKHMALGRKVVVFHDYNEGGGINPFEMLIDPDKKVEVGYGDKRKSVKLKDLYDEFIRRRPDALEMKFAEMRSPLVTLQAAFPGAIAYNGTVSEKNRAKGMEAFNTDGSGRDLIIVQSAAGEFGISLHDTTGAHQRVFINLGMPSRPVTAIQEEGRIYRTGQVSNALFRYMNTGTNWERWTFAGTIAQRSGTAENLALGNKARSLQQSFIDAFNESDTYPPTEDEGTGGKEKDRALDNEITPYERAKTFYFGQGVNRKKRQQREGIDYFATPEPIGFKMAEWAGALMGDKMLEPSAGHGAIARFFREDTDRTVIEPSSELASRASMATPGARMIVDRFENLHINNKYDAIVMNPPFGTGAKTAIEHLTKAATHLRNGGRIVALLPQGGTASTRLDAFLDEHKDLHVAGRVQLPSVTFERAGTQVRSEIIVLEKQTDTQVAIRIDGMSADLSNAETIKELFDRLENISVKPRLEPITKEVDLAPDQDGNITIAGVEFKTSRVEKNWYAKPLNKLDRARFADVARAARAAGGDWFQGVGFMFPA